MMFAPEFRMASHPKERFFSPIKSGIIITIENYLSIFISQKLRIEIYTKRQW